MRGQKDISKQYKKIGDLFGDHIVFYFYKLLIIKVLRK